MAAHHLCTVVYGQESEGPENGSQPRGSLRATAVHDTGGGGTAGTVVTLPTGLPRIPRRSVRRAAPDRELGLIWFRLELYHLCVLPYSVH